MRRRRHRSGLELAVLSTIFTLCISYEAISVEGATFSSVRHATARSLVPNRPWGSMVGILDLRGGNQASDSDSEGEGYEEGNSEEDDEDDGDSEVEMSEADNTGIDASGSLQSLLRVSKAAAVFVIKMSLKTIKVTSRAVLAAFESDEGEELTATAKIVRTLQRMWQAAWNPEAKEGNAPMKGKAAKKSNISKTDTENTEKERAESESDDDVVPDFGRFLSTSYGVEATRDDIEDDILPILGGSISDALKEARSRARLLVVMIPSSRPRKSKSNVDEDAIHGFLSAEVATVAEKRARKSEDTGSYVLWGAKPGSAESVSAIKRLKATQTNSKGEKRPILLVAYPALVNDREMSKIVPRLLAQHHCSPPPSPEMMAAWLNALRKRHSKQYASMQLERREAKMFQERKEGYKESIQSDRDRQQREQREEKDRQAREKAEHERREAIEQRREELKASLPVEPSSDDSSAITVALRFADGQSSQRRFSHDTKLTTLFNWVDAMFGFERELVVLTTLNGQKTFGWEDSNKSLANAGLSRMTGLRVTQKNASSSATS